MKDRKPRIKEEASPPLFVLETEFTKKVKSVDKNLLSKLNNIHTVLYNPSTQIFKIPKSMTQDKIEEIIFWLEVFGYKEIIEDFSHFLEERFKPKISFENYLLFGTWIFELKGRAVFEDKNKKRFWLRWLIKYIMGNKEKVKERHVLDRVLLYQQAINKEIQKEFSKYKIKLVNEPEENSHSHHFYLQEKLDDILRTNLESRFIMHEGMRLFHLLPEDYGSLSKKNELVSEVEKKFILFKPTEEVKTIIDYKEKTLIRKGEKEAKTYVVYLSTSTGIGTEISEISEKKKEKFLKEREKYDVFINDRRVYVKKFDEQTKKTKFVEITDMEERAYRLLLILLRYKDESLDVKSLFRKVWADVDRDRVGIPEEKVIVRDYLKTPMSRIRALIPATIDFEIIKPRNSPFYLPGGKLKYCVIINRKEEYKFELSDVG